MDITDKTNLAVLQTNSPVSINKNTSSLSQAKSGTDVAKTSAVASSFSAEAESESLAQQLDGAVSRINEYVQNVQRTLEFTVDADSGRDVVKILDKQTEEVIRQVPTEEVLAIARNIAEFTEDNISIFTSEA